MVIEIRERKNYITAFLWFFNMVNVPKQNTSLRTPIFNEAMEFKQIVIKGTLRQI